MDSPNLTYYNFERVAKQSSMISPTSTNGTPSRKRSLTAPREGSSAGLDGDGTRANQQKHEDKSSTRRSCSTKPAISFDLLHAEMATSLAELLSMKKTTGALFMIFFHKTNATIKARSSASKIIVFLIAAPNRSIWL